jgi:hypothetical protein
MVELQVARRRSPAERASLPPRSARSELHGRPSQLHTDITAHRCLAGGPDVITWAYELPLPTFAQPPLLWGTEDHVRWVFAGTGMQLEFKREIESRVSHSRVATRPSNSSPRASVR